LFDLLWTAQALADTLFYIHYLLFTNFFIYLLISFLFNL